jgi:hypothetical protein
MIVFQLLKESRVGFSKVAETNAFQFPFRPSARNRPNASPIASPNPSPDDVNFKELAAVFSQIVGLKGVENLEGSLPSLASFRFFHTMPITTH